MWYETVAASADTGVFIYSFLPSCVHAYIFQSFVIAHIIFIRSSLAEILLICVVLYFNDFY